MFELLHDYIPGAGALSRAHQKLSLKDTLMILKDIKVKSVFLSL